MSDAGKTSTYVGLALLLAVAAFAWRPRPERPIAPGMVGIPIFEAFDDSSKVTGMKIVRFDEDLGEIHTFEVNKNAKSGQWTIPSHSDYPADAESRVRDVATIFVGMKVLGVVTTSAAEHQLFGVLEPNREKLTLGDKGVGLLVQFEADKQYALIVGKAIKGAEGHRFVRRPGQDVVFDVKIDPEKLSTKFDDWIEKDLLKLSTYDVENLRVKDYSLVETVQRPVLERRFEAATKWNNTDSKWELQDFLTYRGRDTVSTKLLPTEELNKQKLDDLKYALGDLKIVDVRRKPKGLTANLRAGAEFMNDREACDSLRSRGFYPIETNNNEFELLTANGEVHVGMKDGVEYVLRFGNVANTSETSEKGKLSRYLLVSARLDQSKLPRPELQELPTELKPEGTEKPAEKPGEKPEAKPAAKPSDTFEAKPAEKAETKPAAKADEKPAAKPEEKPSAKPETKAEAKPEAKTETKPEIKPEPKPSVKPEEKPAAKPAGGNAEGNGLADAPSPPAPVAEPAKAAKDAPAAAKSDAASKPAAAPAKEQPKVETPAKTEAPTKPATAPAETPKTDAAAPGGEPAKTEKPAAQPAKEGTAPAADAQKTKLDEERERITKENQRKLDEWNEKKKKAEAKVRELNSRFADWYYVISEDVYKKIHLSRGDIVKESDKAKEEGFGVDAFRNLQKEGVQKKDEKSSDSKSN